MQKMKEKKNIGMNEKLPIAQKPHALKHNQTRNWKRKKERTIKSFNPRGLNLYPFETIKSQPKNPSSQRKSSLCTIYFLLLFRFFFFLRFFHLLNSKSQWKRNKLLILISSAPIFPVYPLSKQNKKKLYSFIPSIKVLLFWFSFRLSFSFSKLVFMLYKQFFVDKIKQQ